MAKLRTDPEAVSAYRKALADSMLYEPERVAAMADSEVIERTQRMMDAVLEFGRRMKPVIASMGAAVVRVGRVLVDEEQRNPAFAALMASERLRMEAEGGR